MSDKSTGIVDQGLQKLSDSDKKIKRFADILDSLSSTEEKRKLLWKEIYENALIDRENAGMLFTDAWKSMIGGTQDHIALGTTMTKYIEGMRKANDQVLRLAELIEKAEERETKIDHDDVFEQIGD